MNNITQPKIVGTIDFFCIGFGAIVGVGWSVSINNWMTSCGGPVPAAIGYLMVLIIMIPIGLCYAELVSMLPVAGGGMAFAYKAFDEKIATVSGWASLGGMIAIIPWEAIQVTDVLGYLIPGIKSGPVLYNCYGSDVYLVAIVIGIVFSFLIFALNMKGLAAAAFIQKILCFVLVLAALLGAVAALFRGNIENLRPIYDVSNPSIYGEGLKTVSHVTMFGGCFAIVAQAAYFLAGFETIPQGIEDAGGDVKKVGRTVVLSVGLACLFYALLLICLRLGCPCQEFAGMQRPAAATMFPPLYPGPAGKTLYWVIVIGAIAGLLTTWNGFFTASANMMMGMSRGRLIPKAWSIQNGKGIAVIGQITCLVLSVIGPFLGVNLIDSITCFSATAFMLSWTLSAWSLVRLRIKHPEMKRPYKIPGGIGMGLFAVILSTIVLICMFIPASPFYVGALSIKMFLGWMIIGTILFLVSGLRRKGLSREELEKGVFRDKSED